MERTPSINWPAAFVAYCNNCPLEEIAQVYGMSVLTIESRVRGEGWAKLRASIPQNAENQALVNVPRGTLEKPTAGEAKLALIQQNRAINLGLWAALRDDAAAVIDRLRAGTLQFEKIFNGKTGIVRAAAEPSIGDRVNLATYLRTIADGTFRCLGDFQAQEKPAQDAIAGVVSAPSITIILPAVISAPRDQRSEATVIDLRPEAIEALKSANPADQNNTDSEPPITSTQ